MARSRKDEIRHDCEQIWLILGVLEIFPPANPLQTLVHGLMLRVTGGKISSNSCDVTRYVNFRSCQYSSHDTHMMHDQRSTIIEHRVNTNIKALQCRTMETQTHACTGFGEVTVSENRDDIVILPETTSIKVHNTDVRTIDIYVGSYE